MNKCAFLGVFFCGIIFSGFVSILRDWIDLEGLIFNQFDNERIGVLPLNSDIKLMDDGYVALAKFGLFYESYEQLIKRNEINFSTELEERSSELEALNSLKAAVELVAAGKKAKAGRLLEHAHSLAPRHQDVLLSFGEYLEEIVEDVVLADRMFLKALAISPTNSRALKNRRRTQPLVKKLDSTLLLRIDNKRDELSRIPSLSSALRRIKKEAFFHHIYHTAAIEGNTLTLVQIRMILETGLSVGGKSVMEHNEILGLDLALRYINTTLVHRVGIISLSDILEIYRRVLGHVDPIQAGTLRTTQVFVSNHIPPPASKLKVFMEEFVFWLNSYEARNLHPIKYAALAHYKLVSIHPFIDGNGRTARLLMNFLLMQAGYPPVIIRKQDRVHYYNHLQTANDGDTRPFVRFIAHCTEKTVDVYLWATKEHLPEIEQRFMTKNDDKSSITTNDLIIEEVHQGRKQIHHRSYLATTILETNPSTDTTSWISSFDDKEESLEMINEYLWLSDKEEQSDANRVPYVLDEGDIYDTVKEMQRLKASENDFVSNKTDRNT